MTDPRAQGLYHLLAVLRRPRVFWLIGAGASARIVPTTARLKESVIGRFVNCGVCGVSPTDGHPVVQRVIQNLSSPGVDHLYWRESPLTHIPIGYVESEVARLLAPKPPRNPVPEYALLALAHSPATFFVMNLDGLAFRHLSSQHLVLEPHGRIPSDVVNSPEWADLVTSALYDGASAYTEWPFLLPQPEPSHITGEQAYDRAIAVFGAGEDLVVLGYSFGKFGDRIDDGETFAFTAELARWYRKRLFVIDPHPGEILQRIQDSARLSCVDYLPVYWDALAAAILQEVHGRLPNPASLHESFYSRVLYRHDMLRDRGNADQ
jgi:hypothetical protein